MDQTGAGGDSISVGLGSPVSVAVASFGIIANQPGDGDGNSITIASVTTSGLPTNNLRTGPDSIVTNQGGTATNTSGNGDSVVIENVVVYGNITVTQLNGAGDSVSLLGDSAGYETTVGPQIYDHFGVVTVSQGDGYMDTVTLDTGGVENPSVGNLFNYVTITQGDSISPNTPGVSGCCPVAFAGDTVNVNDTTINSDLSIAQGVHGASLGNNTVNIATTSAVSVFDSTTIDESAGTQANNTILLGGFNAPNSASASGVPDFLTGYLDVYTGAGGGAYVQVFNTEVEFGALGTFGSYNINGGGDSNTLVIDVYSSMSVTADPTEFIITMI